MKPVAVAFAAAALLGAPSAACAYRPFDSTDASVADAGEFELELGPLGRLREGAKTTNIAPAAIANIGLSGDRELVIQGQREVRLTRGEAEPRSSLQENGAFIKQVLRRGVLQEDAGPSVATEYGLLLPSIPGHGTGASIAGIVSQRSRCGTVHLNAAVARTREHEADAFLGAILEGPIDWAVRPVAEAFAERTSGGPRVSSFLVGVIWRAGQDLALDFGLRQGHIGSEPVHEVRLGLTWAFSLSGGR